MAQFLPRVALATACRTWESFSAWPHPRMTSGISMAAATSAAILAASSGALVLLVGMRAHEPERDHVRAALLAELGPGYGIGSFAADGLLQGLRPVVGSDVHHFQGDCRLVRERALESEEGKRRCAADGDSFCAAADLNVVDLAAISLFGYNECHESLLINRSSKLQIRCPNAIKIHARTVKIEFVIGIYLISCLSFGFASTYPGTNVHTSSCT